MSDERPAYPRRAPRPAPDADSDPMLSDTALPAAPTPAAAPAATPVNALGDGDASSVPAAPPISDMRAPSPTVEFTQPDTKDQPVYPAPAPQAQTAYAPAAPTAAATKMQATKQRDITVQVNSRIGVEYRDLLDDIVTRTGRNIRDILEELIQRFGDQIYPR